MKKPWLSKNWKPQKSEFEGRLDEVTERADFTRSPDDIVIEAAPIPARPTQPEVPEELRELAQIFRTIGWFPNNMFFE